MAITSKTFEVMSGLTGAIKQLDKIDERGGENLLENAFIAVKDIDLEQLDDDVKRNIIHNIREGLIRLYQERQIAINKEIGLGISFEEVERSEDDEIDIEAEDIFNNRLMHDGPQLTFSSNKTFTDLKIKQYEENYG